MLEGHWDVSKSHVKASYDDWEVLKSARKVLKGDGDTGSLKNRGKALEGAWDVLRATDKR